MRKTDIDRTFDEIVDFSGVERFIDTPVRHYSSGMHIRLAFSVAAHLKPEILLVDEVLAVGDVAFQRKCLRKMDAMTKEGRTIVFVSHNMNAMMNLTQRCLWIQEGRVEASGETPEIVDRYLTSLNASLQVDGWVDLSRLEPSAGPMTKARLTSLRLTDANGKQSGVYGEGHPIGVELGFEALQEVKSLQLGCGVETVDGSVQLFTSPSPEWTDVLAPGAYSARLHLDPNHLRSGDYTLTVTLLANGLRQQTLKRVATLHVAPGPGSGNPVYLQGWAAGRLRFDYEWDPIEPA
jgi:lipopolysaccharide transport system ATP-binding protein